MDDISKTISHNVKTGQYFKDARAWYSHKYIYPVSERSLLVVIATAVSIAACVILYVLYSSFPVTRVVPFIITVGNSLEYYSVLKPLGTKEADPQQSLTEYLVAEYVKNRENYAYNSRDKQLIRVKGASSKQIFKKYETQMSITNPESPVLLYQRMRRTIEIKSITLQKSGLTYDGATVTFKATVENNRTKEKVTTNHLATIAFSLSTISQLPKDKPVLEFVVTNYSAQKE
jgi:type IV secretion system protein VirB8